VTYLIVGGIIVVVILLVVWLRFSASRSDRRSMETYGHALGVLGDVAKRTGPSPSVRLLPRGEPGRAHVKTGESGAAVDRPSAPPGPDAFDGRAAEAQRARYSGERGRDLSAGGRTRGAGAVPPPAAYSRPSASMPVPEHEITFEDRGDEWAGAGRPTLREPGERLASRERFDREPADAPPDDTYERPRHASAASARIQGARPVQSRNRGANEEDGHTGAPGATPGEAATGAVAAEALGAAGLETDPAVPAVPVTTARSQPVSPDELRRQAAVRRLATGAFATLAVIAIIVASIELAGSPTTSAKGTTKGTDHPKAVATTTTTRPAPSTTLKPAAVKPVSTSGNEVTFDAPSGHYVITFSTSSGPCYLGVETGLGTGDYLWSDTVPAGSSASYKASGSVVVNVGAPAYLSASLNGVPVSIPKGVTDDYLAFVSH
jgi:hypothetical protein